MRPARSIPTPPPNRAGSGRAVRSRGEREPLVRCLRISLRKGHSQRLSPLTGRTSSAGGADGGGGNSRAGGGGDSLGGGGGAGGPRDPGPPRRGGRLPNREIAKWGGLRTPKMGGLPPRAPAAAGGEPRQGIPEDGHAAH